MMRHSILPFLAACILSTATAVAQNTFRAIIRDSVTKEPLVGASALISGTRLGARSDTRGNIEIKNIPNGQHTIIFTYVGYEKLDTELVFPLPTPQTFEIYLIPKDIESEEIVVQSTRTSRAIENTPTRVEAVELEEIEEKINMRPANVSMLLHESTGIQVQQTSATSASASIRIQGLDGKYTQLLKDGYPGYGSFGGGLSVLEIPPLDLKQVEIIKGPASTLYGGDAIAGVVNFISKTPKKDPETLLLINQSHVGQTNFGGFASRMLTDGFGFTLLAQVNLQNAYDVDKDDFTELPKSNDVTIIPKAFIAIGESSRLTIGNAFTTSERTGGDVFVIRDGADSTHSYFERNKTLRNNFSLEFNTTFDSLHSFTAKTGFGYYDRSISVPGYSFAGISRNLYTEASYHFITGTHELTAGANFILDRFDEDPANSITARDQQCVTGGVFIQDTWDASELISLEGGVRFDRATYGAAETSEMFLLPRMFVLFRWDPKLTSRIGGGMGYKTPTLFTEQTEALHFRDVQPLSNVVSERSYGGTADINYITELGDDELTLGINQMFFFTRITHPMMLQQDTASGYSFVNADMPVRSLGTETNLRLSYEHYKLFAGYTWTNAEAEYQTGIKTIPLIPEHKLNLALMYENPEVMKAGLEAYYSSPQYLGNGSYSDAYWEFGAMVEKSFGAISVYLNAENFTDTRQSRFKSVVNGAHNNPLFDEIWMHTEGFVFSGGVKIRL